VKNGDSDVEGLANGVPYTDSAVVGGVRAVLARLLPLVAESRRCLVYEPFEDIWASCGTTGSKSSVSLDSGRAALVDWPEVRSNDHNIRSS
jgi:hypothetical protein